MPLVWPSIAGLTAERMSDGFIWTCNLIKLFMFTFSKTHKVHAYLYAWMNTFGPMHWDKQSHQYFGHLGLSCFLDLLLYVVVGWVYCLSQNAKSTIKHEKQAPLFLLSWKLWVPVTGKFILSIFVYEVEGLARQSESMPCLDNCLFPVKGHWLVPSKARRNCPS